MYYWAFNEGLGRYALINENRLVNLNPPPGHVTDDMKRIAAALNREDALGKVREAFAEAIDILEDEGYPVAKICEALAALGEVRHG